MDEFQRIYIRLEEARNENSNAHLSGDRERIEAARAHYEQLKDEFSEIFKRHRERLGQ